MSDLAWCLFFMFCIIMFAGEPDLHDVLINKLSNGSVPIFTNEQAAQTPIDEFGDGLFLIMNRI